MIPLPPEIPTIILSFLFSGKPVKFIIRLKIIFCFLFLLGNHERVSHPTRHFSFYRPEDSDEILKHFCKLSAFNQKTNVHSIVSSVIRLHFRDQKLLRINRNDLNRDHRWNERDFRILDLSQTLNSSGEDWLIQCGTVNLKPHSDPRSLE